MSNHRRYLEPCPARRGQFHDWDSIDEPIPYLGPNKRQVAEYCTFCNEEYRAVVEVPDIEPKRPDRGPFFRNRPKKPAA